MKTMVSRLGVLMVAVTALCAGAFAQEAAPKPTLTKQFGGWALRCYDQKGNSLCQIEEAFVDPEGRPVLQISMFYDPSEKIAVMRIVTPLGMALENGVVLDTDTFKSPALPFRICSQQGCVVTMKADAGVVDKLIKSTKGSVKVVRFRGKEKAFSFQFDGFGAAYQAMVSNSSVKPEAAAPAATAE